MAIWHTDCALLLLELFARLGSFVPAAMLELTFDEVIFRNGVLTWSTEWQTWVAFAIWLFGGCTSQLKNISGNITPSSFGSADWFYARMILSY